MYEHGADLEAKSNLEVVTTYPIGRQIAQLLSYTSIGPAYDNPKQPERWQSAEVLQTTAALIRLINGLGYQIVPRPTETALDDTPEPPSTYIG